MSLRRRDAASDDESEISGVDVDDEFSDSDDSQASNTIRETGLLLVET